MNSALDRVGADARDAEREPARAGRGALAAQRHECLHAESEAKDAERIGRWQQRLVAEARLFDPLTPGSRIGVIAESVLDRSAPPADRALVWERIGTGMRVRFEEYTGFDTVEVDLLIALDATAVEALEDAPIAGWLRAARRLLRDGHVLFFARKPRARLEEAGYDDLLHQLGFAYLGACR